MFDLFGNGDLERWSWPISDDAWLAMDRNNNGFIDNGTELFGSSTDQPECDDDVPNGFVALAKLDQLTEGGNGDGFIDINDTVFSRLRLWQDRNHNGFSEPNELFTLPQLGIARIDLSYKKKKTADQYGNVFGFRARIWDSRGEQSGKWAYDVFLKKSE